MRKAIFTILLLCILSSTVGCSNNQDESSQDVLSESEELDYTSFVGTWCNEEDYSNTDIIPEIILIFEEADTEHITFSIAASQASGEIVETSSITSEIEDGKTSFSYKDNFNGKGKGSLTFKEDAIVINLETSEDSTGTYDISTNTKVYKYEGTIDLQELANSVKDDQEQEQQKQEDVQDTETATVTSRYIPASGGYTNGTDGNYYCITVSVVDQSSFKFFIESGMTGDLVFKEHIAVFEEQDSTVAVYRGQNYTLYFDCSEYATITLTGFEDVINSSENTFWNPVLLNAG